MLFPWPTKVNQYLFSQKPSKETQPSDVELSSLRKSFMPDEVAQSHVT